MSGDIDLHSSAISIPGHGRNSYSEYETAHNDVDPNEMRPNLMLHEYLRLGGKMSEWRKYGRG